MNTTPTITLRHVAGNFFGPKLEGLHLYGRLPDGMKYALAADVVRQTGKQRDQLPENNETLYLKHKDNKVGS